MDKNKVNPWILCIFLALVVGFFIGGCTTAEQRQRTLKWEREYEAEVREYAELAVFLGGSLQVARDVRAKKISIGMTRNDVYKALRLTGIENNNSLRTSSLSPGASYGEAIDVNRTVNAFGTYDQWVMPDSYSGPKYIYIDDGILTSWQNR